MPSINDRAAEAADPGASAVRLRDLATDRSVKVRAAVAANPSAPADVLAALVDDSRWEVSWAVAENRAPHARAIALAAPDKDVRLIATRRPDLTSDDVDALSTDPHKDVRAELALTCRDEAIVARLARDNEPTVRASTLHNPRLSDQDAEMLAKDRIARVRSVAAASGRLSRTTLTQLADDRSADVRWNVLVHHTDRPDLAAHLTTDPDTMNATQARSQLEDPD